MPRDIDYRDPVPGKPLACPHCGLLAVFRIDEYGCLRQGGGCMHIVVVEHASGAIRVGYYDSEQ